MMWGRLHLPIDSLTMFMEGLGGNYLFDEDRVKKCRLGDDDTCTVSLSDTWVPQSSYVDDEIPACHGIILLYSTTSRSSFQEVSRTCRQLPLNAHNDRNLTLILVGTKSDDNASREVTPEEGRALADELGCRGFFETSAKSGENVNEAVSAMVLALRKAMRERKVDVMSSFLMIFRLISRFRGGGSRIQDAG
ncbi:hypothetical protein M413DRAFT_261470 [Hebeloma cylindrosporum]|uniref:Uncharacterized protein n=1 Tax=Hebeloma cylindrosporum TaxID=76867 RepID=A0A0C2YA71_HEBCY|nr:hypothetical protein M413DRAFT_261470 [Hebeloma cylindrosporum h7]